MIAVRPEHRTQFQGYSAAVLSSATDIQRLKPSVVRAIPQNDILFDPEFFLSSLSPEWGPKVVALYSGNERAGIVYAKESIVSRLRLGVVYADLSFGSVPIGDFIQRQDTFR